jgi:DNA-binding LacI/PurR family transcriptional regulator
MLVGLMGLRRLAIIGGPQRLWTSEQRLAGFRESIASAGLDPDQALYVGGDYGERSGYRAAAELLGGELSRRPTAILCANDLMAIGVMRFCREAGISIPGDLSLTGFDDIAGAEFLEPALSTVAQPAHDMGRAAAELLLHRVGVRPAPPETVQFMTTARIRDSVAAPAYP